MGKIKEYVITARLKQTVTLTVFARNKEEASNSAAAADIEKWYPVEDSENLDINDIEEAYDG